MASLLDTNVVSELRRPERRGRQRLLRGAEHGFWDKKQHAMAHRKTSLSSRAGHEPISATTVVMPSTLGRRSEWQSWRGFSPAEDQHQG